MSAAPLAIIAGAPKCGTSALFDYLSDAPSVSPARRKELRVFLDEAYPLPSPFGRYLSLGASGYESLFGRGPTRSDQVLLEATPDYLYQSSAASRIAEAGRALDRPVRVVIALREPAERARSMFYFARDVIRVVPSSIEFRTYVEAIVSDRWPDSLEGRPLLRSALDHANYPMHLERFETELGGSSLLVLDYEELRSEAGRQSVLSHCEIDRDPTHPLPVRNVSTAPRFPRLVDRLRPASAQMRSRAPAVLKRLLMSSARSQVASRDDAPALDKLREYFDQHGLPAEMRAYATARELRFSWLDP